MPRLLVIKGADEGKQFDLAEPVMSLGRDVSNQIRLFDTEVSRKHAELRMSDAGFELVDHFPGRVFVGLGASEVQLALDLVRIAMRRIGIIGREAHTVD